MGVFSRDISANPFYWSVKSGNHRAESVYLGFSVLLLWRTPGLSASSTEKENREKTTTSGQDKTSIEKISLNAWRER